MHSIVRNFMHLDPATRYQIAKNAFNRELYDARVSGRAKVRFITWCMCAAICVTLRLSTLPPGTPLACLI